MSKKNDIEFRKKKIRIIDDDVEKNVDQNVNRINVAIRKTS